MAKATVLQTNFTAGEISPQLYGRVDISKYQNGAKAMRDLLPQVYGGAKRRPGTLFVKEVKDSTKRVRLIPFVRSNQDAYLLEFGDLYVRVYKNGDRVGPGTPAAYNGATAYVPGNLVSSGGVNYWCKANTTGNAPPNATYWYPMPAGVFEIPSPYTEAQLGDIDYCQGADTMFLFHESVAPYSLVSAGDTTWTLGATAFLETPFVEVGTYPAATLTPSAIGPVGDTIYLISGEATGTTIEFTSFNWGSGAAGFACAAPHTLATGDAVVIGDCTPDGYNRTSVVAINGASNFEIDIRNDPGRQATGSVGRFTKIVPTAVFAAGDVGKFVKINGGIVKITAFVNSGVVQGIVKQEMSSLFGSPADGWSMHDAAWTVARGYPRTGTLFEQRLVCGGSPTFPQTIWGSITGAYLDFTQGTGDDDAFSFTIASDTVNPIRYLASNKVLVALTTGGEFTLTGGVEKALSPTNAQIKAWTNYGCAGVRPVRYRNAELFVQRAGRKVRKFGYNAANEDWTAPDITVLAEHMTEGGIAGMCWQQEPNSIVWAYREDGALLSTTHDGDQDVTAWAHHEGFGQPDEDGAITALVESVASIPSTDGDEVWVSVQRTINGSTKRYIERFSDTTSLDCAIVATGAAATVWSGLTHLQGDEVGAVADGSYAGAFTVSGGQITLTAAATEVNIGLNFTSRLGLLDPEMQTGMGSASGNAMRTSEVTARFFETTGAKVNGKPIVFRTAGAAVLGTPPERFTGVKRLENLGWERGEDPLEITQDEPMPFHLLSLTRKFTVNEG